MPFAQFQMAGTNTVSFTLEGSNYTLNLDTYEVTRQLPPFSFSMELVKSEAERGVPGTYPRERFLGLGPMPSPEALSPDGKWIAHGQQQQSGPARHGGRPAGAGHR